MTKKRTGFIAAMLILLMLCLPILSANAGDERAGTAVLTIRYYDSGTEGKMVAEPYKAELLKGSRYQVNSPDVDSFVLSDPGNAVMEGMLEEDTEISVYYDDGRDQADYTVEYIGRDERTEKVLARETFRALEGKTVNVEDKYFENFEKEKGQDMTLLVSADGRAEKKIYYTRIFYDRIVFRTQGTYIPSIHGWEGEDISSEIEKAGEPVRQGYIFKGWDKELPDVMPKGEYVVNAVWEPGESQYTVLRWMENAEDDGYTLLGETEIRTAQTGSTVTALQEDIDRAGFMADWFPDSEYYKDYYGFDYARCEDAIVTADGKAVLNLYYDREIWTVNLHEEAEYESGTSDSLLPNDDIWYTARGKYGSALPDDFPSFDEMGKYYMGKTQLQDVKFLGVRDEFVPVSRHLDTFYFQDLAAGNHTFDAYPWMGRDAYPIQVIYLKEGRDGTFRRVRQESAQVDRDPSVYGAEVTVLHPKGLTCEGGWYTTGNSSEECEQGERIPIRTDQIHSDGKCSFRGVKSHLFVYLKRDTFTLNYMDIKSDGTGVVYKSEKVTYKEDVDLGYIPEPEGEHENDRFTGWYLSPALSNSEEPIAEMSMPAENVNVYAGWDAAEWSVTFDTTGGTETPDKQLVKDGEYAKMPDNPEKEDHIFLGWFTESGGNDSRQAWNFDRAVEADMTLYAGWHPVGDTASYTVRHIIEGEDSPFHEESGTGRPDDTIFVSALGTADQGYPFDLYLESSSSGQKFTLEKAENDNVITLTYKKPALRRYTVSYIDRETEEKLWTDKEAETEKAIVTEFPVNLEGYAPSKVFLSESLVRGDKNQITFHYIKSHENDGESAKGETQKTETPGGAPLSSDNGDMQGMLLFVVSAACLAVIMDIRNKKTNTGGRKRI